MAIRITFILWLGIISISYGQDSTRIEYLDLNLPDYGTMYTNADKYGPDKSLWPVWARKRVTLSMFREDTIHIEQLTLNDYFSFTFDKNQIFKFEDIPENSKYLERGVIQNDINFRDYGRLFFLSYYYLPDKTGSTDVDIIHKGQLIDMNSLESAKKHFPNSFAWRDGRSNSYYSNGPPDVVINYTTLNFIERGTNAVIQFYYDKDDLVCIYGYF